VAILGPLGDRVLTLPAAGEAGSVVVARERASTVLRALRSGGRRSLPDDTPPFADAETSEPDPTGGREAVGLLLAQWLQYYGPVSERFIVQTSGVAPEVLAGALEAIPDAIIRGNLIEASGEIEVCDAANFETLLRIGRRQAVPSLVPRPLHALPSFLARFQNLAAGGDGPRALHRCLEQLSCYSAAAAAWETEVLPARLSSYVPSWMDALMDEGEIMWVGCGNQRVCFVAGGDLDLLPPRRGREPGRPADAGHQAVERAVSEEWNRATAFPDPRGRYDFGVLLERSGGTAQELADRLWDGVWKGTISNDGFGALRKGIENQFRVPGMTLPPPSAGRRRFGRTSFSRWKGSLPMAGTWFSMPEPEATDDPIELEERIKARARCVLERYGIIFRELLANEPPPFRWPALFRALRLMELSGEIAGGYFFEGIPGLQFASHKGLSSLHDERGADTVYWMSATDPASLCGVRLPGLKGLLPRRVPGNHLVFHGERPVVASERWGGSLTFRVPPDHPDAIRYLGFLEHLLARPVQPLRRVTVARINGQDAAGSPYLDVLRARFDAVAEHRHVSIHRRY
jgi:ATP-dependent Lhr-like helicase